VGVGCQRLGLTTKPTQLAKKQALAAVGQVHLMKYYEDFLQVSAQRAGAAGRRELHAA
jgi:glutamate 5-kinase